ncbi:hypothetical protein DPMN_135771 [Dreissena polymorpha]|uniref:Uncharacterized protein n=1 Tax=Dreissena polymorpha TaxID=45954 RepID=A0A9D4FYM3_DREPO|nr:hypothetical protein DPMN_135771 [Dreissena polymorpha]
MSNRSKRDTKKINYKKLNDSGMADVGEQNLKIEKSTEVTQLEATAEVHVNKNGVLQLLEDDEIDEDELSHMKEEIENLKRQEEQLRKKQDFHETKKQLEKQKAKIESLKGKVKVLSNGNTYSKTKSKSSKKSDHEHKLTIDDLRKDKLLTNKVKKQISKLGLIDESLSESDVDSESIYNFSEQESVHSESDGDSSSNSEISQISSKRSVKAIKSKKSGIAITANDKVKHSQRYPHTYLRYEFVSKNMTFESLDLNLFRAGELEIISDSKTKSTERNGRLELLKRIMYLSMTYEFEGLKCYYAAVLREIELGKKNGMMNSST